MAESGKKFIPFRDASKNYTTSFWLEDGKTATVIRHDGQRNTQTCKYIDDYHFYFGSNCFHVVQFAEFLQRNGLRCEPESYITDLQLYEKKYLDRELKDVDGIRIPYRAILSVEKDIKHEKIVAICPQTRIDRMVAVSDWSYGCVPVTNYCSVDDALSKVIPSLDIPRQHQELLNAVFYEVGKQIPRISQQEYDAIPKDYKGTYSDFNGKHPEWKGRATAFLPGHGTTLFIDGVSFILETGKKPSLDDLVKNASGRSDSMNQAKNVREGTVYDR